MHDWHSWCLGESITSVSDLGGNLKEKVVLDVTGRLVTAGGHGDVVCGRGSSKSVSQLASQKEISGCAVAVGSLQSLREAAAGERVCRGRIGSAEAW